MRAQQGSERGREAREGRSLVCLEAVTERERGGGGNFFTLTKVRNFVFIPRVCKGILVKLN